MGLTGKDGGLIKAKKKLLNKSSKKDEEVIDIGLVGEVREINPEILNSLERDGFIPVISSFFSARQRIDVGSDQADLPAGARSSASYPA